VSSGRSAFSFVQRLRSVVSRSSGGAALVGGQSAQDYDLATISRQDELLVIPLVLAVVLVVLVLLLRALSGPVVVIITVIATFAAALGVGSIVFDAILTYPGVDPTVPLLSFVFLIALGVDYNVFLLGRVSEEIELHGTTRGVAKALAVTGSVLTAAGLILAGTFTVLIILPLLPSKEIGVVVALGVLLDTLVVRTILVPSLAVDMGAAFWWPRRPGTGHPGAGSGDRAPGRWRRG
jgi:putative drug exporter of the RND superfamily